VATRKQDEIKKLILLSKIALANSIAAKNRQMMSKL